MLFLRGTLILLLITTMSSPVIIEMAPTLLESLILIPKIAIGSFIISQGTGIIAAQLLWKVLQYRKIKERNLERFKYRGPEIISGKYYGWDNSFEGSSNLPRTKYPPPPHLRVKPLTITDRVKAILNSVQKGLPEDISKFPLGTIEIPVPADIEFPEGLGINNKAKSTAVLERRMFDEYQSEIKPVSKSVPLEYDEYMKLMSWTEGNPLEFAVGSKSQTLNMGLGVSGNYETRKKNPIYHVNDVTKFQRKSDDMRLDFGTSSPFKEDSFLSPIIKDIGNFFSLVSKFDDNNCLEKLICEIHMKAKNGRISRDKLSTYERHVIDAFSVLDSLLIDSSVNNGSRNKSMKSFFKAAHLGRSSSSNSACKKTYRNCKYNSNFIIGLSNKFMFTKSTSSSPLASTNHSSQHSIRKRVLQ